jgi:uncharacterized protein (TIGR03118 family)
MKTSWVGGLAGISLLIGFVATSHATGFYRERDLVSDLEGRADRVDEHLKNPWGLARLPDGALRVSDADGNVSTAYDPRGNRVGTVIGIPPDHEGNPTGVVINPFPRAFKVANKNHRFTTRLLFVTEQGTIAAYSPEFDRDRAVQVASGEDASYKGVAVADAKHGPFLYAANFHRGTIDVFDRNFNRVWWKGAFEDHDLPADYAPFNIQNLGGKLYVCWAKQDEEREDEVAGPGLGFVDVYDFNGRLLRRVATGGTLNAPWGLAAAPHGFGRFGDAILVGNFGDGRINAFARNGRFLGQLEDEKGVPIAIPGLWGLAFGDGRCEGRDQDGRDDREGRIDDQRLYFAAGINDEENGLFGFIAAIGGPHGAADTPPELAAMAAPQAIAFSARMVGANPVRIGDGAGVAFRITNGDPAPVDLGIFDVTGRLIAEPLRRQTVTGETTVRWDGRDRSGARVDAGSYYFRASAGPRVETGHVVILP